MKRLPVFSCLMTVAMAALLTGCPPQPVLNVSTTTLRFGVDDVDPTELETVQTFEVFNNGGRNTTLVVNITSSEPWLTVTPSTATSTGADDVITVTATVNRDFSELKQLDFADATITVESSVGTELIAVTTAPEFFTEAFNTGADLEGLALTFRPNGGPNFYEATKTEITEFPTDPSDAAQYPLSFDTFGDPVEAGLFGGEAVAYYGQMYEKLFISSNGWVSFGTTGNDPVTFGEHFETPQISGPGVDATDAGAMVTYQQDEDKLVITYMDAPTKGAPGSPNDFQVEMFFDGTIQVSFLSLDPALSGIIGLSSGAGVNGAQPMDFLPSDLTSVNTGTLKTSLLD
jgi:hypothetical protein